MIARTTGCAPGPGTAGGTTCGIAWGGGGGGGATGGLIGFPAWSIFGSGLSGRDEFGVEDDDEDEDDEESGVRWIGGESDEEDEEEEDEDEIKVSEGFVEVCEDEDSEWIGSEGVRVVGELVGVASEGLDGLDESSKSWLLWVASGDPTTSKRLSMSPSGIMIFRWITARSSSWRFWAWANAWVTGRDEEGSEEGCEDEIFLV